MNNQINDKILTLIGKTHDSLMLGIAGRVKERRLEKNWTQRALALKMGISFGSLRLLSLLLDIIAVASEVGIFKQRATLIVQELSDKCSERKMLLETS